MNFRGTAELLQTDLFKPAGFTSFCYVKVSESLSVV